MNPEWLCYVEGQEYGPYTWPQLVQMAAAGNIIPTSYVRRHHDSQWYTADQVPGLFGPAVPVSPKHAARPAGAPPSPAASGAMKKVSTTKTAIRTATPQTHSPPPADTRSATLTPPEGMPELPPAIPQELPRGRVASKPAAAQQQPVATQSPTAGKPGWIPVVKEAAPGQVSASPLSFPATAKTTGEVAPAKKPDKSKTMVLALGGAIAGVALIGIIAVVWKMNQKPPAIKEVVTATPVEIPTTEVDPLSAIEANPTDAATAPATTAASATKKGTAPAATTGLETKPAAAPSDAAAVLLVKSVKQWKPIEEFGKIGVVPGLTCTKIDAWLAADATGRRVNVKLQTNAAAGEEVQASVAPAAEGAAAEPPAIAAPVTGTGGTQFVATEAAPFLFVQVTINNGDKVKPRPYAGWNVGDTAAILADATGKPFSVVPPAATPGVTRIAAKEVLPGETIVDTLVFAVPPAGDLLFRLALPKPAFSAKQTGAWGYEVSGAGLATLAAGPQGAAAEGNVAAPAPVVRPMVALPIPGVQEEPKSQPALAGPAPEPEVKKPAFNPNGPIPIPGLTDVPADKPAGPKKPEEVPNLNAPPKKK
jgi:hypothetical protein